MTGCSPYQRIEVRKDIVLAARGLEIYTFSIRSGAHLSSWRYPTAADTTVGHSEQKTRSAAREVGEEEISKPPAKRRKIEGSGSNQQAKNNAGENGNGQAMDSKGESKKKNTAWQEAPPQGPEPAMIYLLASTTDGKYVVAVTSHDKAIWVLEHDGNGSLVDISHR